MYTPEVLMSALLLMSARTAITLTYTHFLQLETRKLYREQAQRVKTKLIRSPCQIV